jgi:phosphatidylglycerophosphatase C
VSPDEGSIERLDPADRAVDVRLIVFDFDNTLYAGDSGTQLITWLLRRNWWRMLAATLAAPVIAPLWLGASARRLAISTYLWIGTVGARHGEMTHVVDRYVAAADVAALRSRLRPQGMDAVAGYRRPGDQVVVLTGAPRELVQTILASDAGDPVCVVGSTSRGFMGGLVIDRHCYGVHKLTMLHAAGHTVQPATAYSDSPIDLPLLRRAAKPILVNPSAFRVALFRRILGADVEIQYWSPDTWRGRKSTR